MSIAPFDLTPFTRDVFPRKKSLFESLARDGQSPRALIIGCSDSRVIPELFTSAEPGDLFVSRNAGNIVPPAGAPGDAVTSAVEYAVNALGVPNIIVCGHSGCGAMHAFDTPEALEALPLVRDWIDHAKPADEAARTRRENAAPADLLATRIEENVKLQLRNLKTHKAVADAIDAGALSLHGWVFDIASGQVSVLDPETEEFGLPADAAPAPLTAATGA